MEQHYFKILHYKNILLELIEEVNYEKYIITNACLRHTYRVNG